MEKLNYKEIAQTQQWKELREMFAKHPDKETRANIIASFRHAIREERDEYEKLAKRNSENNKFIAVLDNYENGLIALKEVDGVDAY